MHAQLQGVLSFQMLGNEVPFYPVIHWSRCYALSTGALRSPIKVTGR